MNTERTDREQMSAINEWCRVQAKKRMEKAEKRLLYWAKIYYGEPVAVIYARKGSYIVDKDGNQSEVDV